MHLETQGGDFVALGRHWGRRAVSSPAARKNQTTEGNTVACASVARRGPPWPGPAAIPLEKAGNAVCQQPGITRRWFGATQKSRRFVFIQAMSIDETPGSFALDFLLSSWFQIQASPLPCSERVSSGQCSSGRFCLRGHSEERRPSSMITDSHCPLGMFSQYTRYRRQWSYRSLPSQSVKELALIKGNRHSDTSQEEGDDRYLYLD